MPTLSADEARSRFETQPVARLATVARDCSPHLVPVTFALWESADAIVTAVDHKPKGDPFRLKRLRNILDRGSVAVLADHYDPDDWSALWWARADGNAMVYDPGSSPAVRAVELLVKRYPEHYADQPPAGPVIVVAVDHWSGWTAS
jgi:PPOX class probable F420-dependent enzyme